MLTPLNEAAEADRAKRVSESFGEISPNLVKDTTDFLFRDLWLRPDLAPRDRSLVTVTCLVSGYRTNELPFHLKRALENGVTREELIEILDRPIHLFLTVKVVEDWQNKRDFYKDTGLDFDV